MTTKNKSGSSFGTKIVIAFVVIGILILAFTGFNYYIKYFGGNVQGDTEYLYIKTGSKLDDVIHTLEEENILKDVSTFRWAAENMNYTKIKPGRYKLEKGMNNRTLINKLKSGNQDPVQLKFRNLRQRKNLAGAIAKQIEADSITLLKLLDSAEIAAKYGFNKETFYAMFLPNSYEVYWNTSAEEFIEKMNAEYKRFWTDERKQKADKLGFTPQQVSTLAAIVDAEALHDDEMPTIAGLYINRYKKGIKLEADPTVIYANNDFTIRRVLNKHLRVESPYNTYRVKGLPPGPIMMPSISAIDAVLNYRDNDYLFMCAKEDFSGYHNFATNMKDHMVNARKFQKALNERNIKK